MGVWQLRGKVEVAAQVTDCWRECVAKGEILELHLWRSRCGKSRRMGVADWNTDQRWEWRIAG